MARSAVRFSVEPGDVPPAIAARRMGLTISDFEAKLPRLLSRGFPAPDPDTGNFDLDAIDTWRKLRHRQIFHSADLTPADSVIDARARIERRLAEARGASG